MRDVTKLGLRLFIFTLIAALALAVTNEITSGPIAQQELAAGQAAQRAVLPEAEIFETQEIQTAPEYDQITELYVGKTGDEVVGYVMTASPQGYGGPIPITLGIGADGSIHGVSVGDLQETAGLGSKVGEEPFTSQFPGLPPTRRRSTQTCRRSPARRSARRRSSRQFARLRRIRRTCWASCPMRRFPRLRATISCARNLSMQPRPLRRWT